jgi:hypothetical protein
MAREPLEKVLGVIVFEVAAHGLAPFLQSGSDFA